MLLTQYCSFYGNNNSDITAVLFRQTDFDFSLCQCLCYNICLTPNQCCSQITLIFLQNMNLLLSKTPQADIRNHVLPMVYRSLECDTPQIQVSLPGLKQEVLKNQWNVNSAFVKSESLVEIIK